MNKVLTIKNSSIENPVLVEPSGVCVFGTKEDIWTVKQSTQLHNLLQMLCSITARECFQQKMVWLLSITVAAAGGKQGELTSGQHQTSDVIYTCQTATYLTS